MLLKVDELTVRYGRIPAVRGVSLEVAAGEIVGVVGPNGAGKSTTLAAIAGLRPAAAGSVRLEDREILGRRPEDIVRSGLALVPEGRSIFAGMSVADNLRLGLSATPRAHDGEAAIERVLDRFEVLRRYFNSAAGKLSGGEQQQLAIARALLCAPRLLLLDEPSLGLAPLIVDLVFETLASLREEGVTILLVEQKATRTIAFADRSYILNAGRITHAGDRRTLTEEIDMGSAYLGL